MRKKVLLSLVVISALVSLLTLSACSGDNGFDWGTECGEYEDADSYIASDNFTYNAADITAVNIYWVSGSVNIVNSDSPTLSVSELGSWQSKEQMHYFINDGILTIHFWQSGYSTKFTKQTKHMTAQIPSDINLTVENISSDIKGGTVKAASTRLATVSGDVDITSLTVDTFESTSVSGDIEIDRLVVATGIGSISTTSGDIEVDALFGENASFKSVSGNINVEISECATLTISTTSGDVEIDLLPTNGAIVEYLTTSGRFESSKTYLKENGKYVFAGLPTTTVKVNTTSGNLEID